ncbi:MAG: T9SS type A sorting domain-containing protein [Alphaproteobacteria bacterium]|nr:T9SS type A sorting domain-containing protein [Alphaproteobacteria bacterium]
MKTPLRLLFGILCSLPGILFAQSWQNICSPGTTFYSNSDTVENIKAFRLDSTLVLPGQDTACYSYRTIRDSLNMFNCLDTTGGSVLGEKVILTHDGWYYFFNRNDDTIRINTASTTGQSWRFCNLSGGGYVTATVNSLTVEQVLGQSDQVKLITLQAKNQSGANISHPLNDQPFKLSQHYGLVTFYDVYFLPEQVRFYSLEGKSTPPMGAQDFGWRDVYDFSVGDQFHYEGHIDDMGGMADTKTIMNVIGKTGNGTDSVDYIFERCRRMEAAPPPGVTTLHDTILIRYNFLALDTITPFTPLPGELSVSSTTLPDQIANRYSRRSKDFNNRQVKAIEYDSYNFGITLPTCWSNSLWEYWHLEEYAPGLGLTHNQTLEMWSGSQESLVWFNRSGETWGTPVAPDCQTLVGIEDHPIGVQPIVTVFPNPASDKITVTPTGSAIDAATGFSLYNLQGKQVLYANLNHDVISIATDFLPRGIYFWKVTSSDWNGSGKLILQ